LTVTGVQTCALPIVNNAKNLGATAPTRGEPTPPGPACNPHPRRAPPPGEPHTVEARAPRMPCRRRPPPTAPPHPCVPALAHGRAAGDVLLRELGALLQAMVRADDVACRYDSEQFVLILPECALEDAVGRAEHVRSECKSGRLESARERPISVSIGVSSYPVH